MQYSGLELAPQTERMFPYSGLKGGTRDRDLLGDAGRNTIAPRSNSTPRSHRLTATRGPGGFKPPPSGTGRRHDLDVSNLELKATQMQNSGFKGGKKPNHGDDGYATAPLLPTPPATGPKTSGWGGNAVLPDMAGR